MTPEQIAEIRAWCSLASNQMITIHSEMLACHNNYQVPSLNQVVDWFNIVKAFWAWDNTVPPSPYNIPALLDEVERLNAKMRRYQERLQVQEGDRDRLTVMNHEEGGPA